MTFDRPFLLLLLLLPVLFVAWQWRSAPSKAGLLLKAFSLLAIVLALAEPKLSIAENKVASIVLVDTSAGVPAEDLRSAADFIRQLDRGKGRNTLRVIPFALTSRPLANGEAAPAWNLRTTSGDAGRGTDLESAMRDGIAAITPDSVPRIMLLSDGNENHGNVARAAYLARQLGIPIDTQVLKGRPQPLLRMESVSLPAIAFSGEKFPIDLTLSAPRKAAAEVDLFAEGKKLGTQNVQIEPGLNSVRVHTSLNVTGAVEITGVVRSPGMGDVRWQQALTLRRPKILFASTDPAGTEKHLLDALGAAQFDVVRSADAVTPKLNSYQIVALNNVDLENLPPPRKDELERYVKEGGGLLVIAGERNVYKENKKVEDAIDRVLPAKLAPPRTPEGTCLVLIVDKSSSMEGRKMELARQAAIGVIENLRPVDQVGVLIFDNSFHWAVPIRRAEDRGTIKRLVAGITPDGGTQIAPALAEGYRRISVANATYRHVVLLTDGISEEGDSLNVAKDAAGKKVTISTVGLGQDVNRAYLEKIATFAKGRSYFLTDPSGLEQILLKDVMEHTGTTAVEKPINPLISRQSTILENVGMESAPPLRGYVKFVSKPGADTILKAEKEDPLFAAWQLGLGRASVFTSDAKSRWAESWIGWSGFDKFWINVFRDLLPHAQPGEARASWDSATGVLTAEYKISSRVPAPVRVPDIFVIGPGGFRKPLPVRKVAEGSYRGEISIGSQRGLFRIRPLEESPLFPETGLYRDELEMTQYGNNENLLRHVSQYTGGRFQPSPRDVWNTGGRSVASSMRLWPGLVALGIVLNLAEILLRKWDGIRQTLFMRSARTARA